MIYTTLVQTVLDRQNSEAANCRVYSTKKISVNQCTPPPPTRSR